jgi:hypothetical protein
VELFTFPEGSSCRSVEEIPKKVDTALSQCRNIKNVTTKREFSHFLL